MTHNLPANARPLGVFLMILTNSLLSLIGAFAFLLYFTPSRPKEIEIQGFSEPFDLFLATGFLLVGGVHFLILFGLLKAKRWSLLIQKLVAIPYFFTFPFGTLYALAVYIAVNRREVEEYVSQKNKTYSLI